MIVDKHATQPVVPETPEQPDDSTSSTQETSSLQEAIESNAMIEAYKAVRDILAAIPSDPNNKDSEPLFKTIKIDNGQLTRIKMNTKNNEYGIAFPAVFIHFIDVYYVVGAAKISEGRGTMRIHYVLNRLNNGDDGEEGELEGLAVYKRIISAIESKKNTFPALINRFQLEYWDQPESFDDGVQPYWIDYQIWFNDYTAYRYKDYVDAYAIQPPYTNFSDQNETANPDKLPDDKTTTYEESSGLEMV